MQDETDAAPERDVVPSSNSWAARGLRAALVLTAAWWGLLLLVALELKAWIFGDGV